MTVLTENAITQTTGDGVTTFFAFDFGIPLDPFDVLVAVDTELVPFTRQANGVVIEPPPAAGAVILIIRLTSQVDQLRDWRPYGPFEADKTEAACDKLILLKQEALQFRFGLNLFLQRERCAVVLLNDRGEDPRIPLYSTDGSLAGVVAGKMWKDGLGPVPGTVDPCEGFLHFVGNVGAPPPDGPEFLSETVFFGFNDGQMTAYGFNYDAGAITVLHNTDMTAEPGQSWSTTNYTVGTTIYNGEYLVVIGPGNLDIGVIGWDGANFYTLWTATLTANTITDEALARGELPADKFVVGKGGPIGSFPDTERKTEWEIDNTGATQGRFSFGAQTHDKQFNFNSTENAILGDYWMSFGDGGVELWKYVGGVPTALDNAPLSGATETSWRQAIDHRGGTLWSMKSGTNIIERYDIDYDNDTLTRSEFPYTPPDVTTRLPMAYSNGRIIQAHFFVGEVRILDPTDFSTLQTFTLAQLGLDNAFQPAGTTADYLAEGWVAWHVDPAGEGDIWAARVNPDDLTQIEVLKLNWNAPVDGATGWPNREFQGKGLWLPQMLPVTTPP